MTWDSNDLHRLSGLKRFSRSFTTDRLAKLYWTSRGKLCLLRKGCGRDFVLLALLLRFWA
jgi:hypothetical protein